MLLYSNDISSRASYIIAFLGNQLSDHAFILTTKADEFLKFEGPKINYSRYRICDDEFWILPHSLLYEKGVKEQKIDKFEFEGVPCFFKTAGDIPFDILAASFFLISRYEEYLPHAKDLYGRYAHENSAAFVHGFLNRPLVDQWIKLLKSKLRQKFPAYQPPSRSFSFLPTYDVDEAFSYLHKGFLRSVAGILNGIFRGNWNLLSERWRVLRKKQPDPYASFSEIEFVNDKYSLKPVYFFLVAQQNGQFDRNILPARKALREIIFEHAVKYEIGLHPSWRSGNEIGTLEMEKKLLEKIASRPILNSRQHYIRFTLPATYQHLLKLGITSDFSMGYGSINGFRASTSLPYKWYDLENEAATELMVYPFCFMDANALYEQNLTPEMALKELTEYYLALKEVNGVLTTIWHNNILGTSNVFTGWKKLYFGFLEIVNSEH